MRVMNTEDAGLSDSSYELITGADTESQDDNYAESINESVASSDLQRPDDVYSLAGTETTYDDESIADDDVVVHLPPAAPEEDAEELPSDTLVLDQEGPAASGDHDQERTLEPQPEPEPEYEHSPQPSLEYTQQNLSTPSIVTPEASAVVENPASTKPSRLSEGNERPVRHPSGLWIMFKDWRDGLEPANRHLLYVARSFGCQLLLGLLVYTVLARVLPDCSPPLNTTAAPHIPTTASSTAFSSTQRTTLTTSAVTSGLLPADGSSANDWSFTTKKSEFYIIKSRGDYVISAVPKIQHQCFSVAAQRGDTPINFDTAPTDDGVLVKFPYNESFGVVTLKVSSKCRPKVLKTFEVLFPERGIMEEALELARNMAQGIPAFAEEARRSLRESASGKLAASKSASQDLIARFRKAHRSIGALKAETIGRLENVKADAAKRVADLKAREAAEQLSHLREQARKAAQLHLLNAQLAAKIWWLKTTGSEDYESYKRKARDYVATMRKAWDGSI